jgi:hypothetical protein
MKLRRPIPQTLNDISVEDYLHMKMIIGVYKKDDGKILKGIADYYFDESTIKESSTIISGILDLLAQPPRFIERFEYRGTEYGFIPNLEEITTAEYIDLDDFQKEETAIPEMLSILYRPIVSKDKKNKNYRLSQYRGTTKEDINTMKKVSIEIYLGAMVFFWELNKDLLIGVDIYTNKGKK